MGIRVLGVRSSRAGLACCATVLIATPAAAAAGVPGAPGVGDPYFPGYGNGGYTVEHYDIELDYEPDADHLRGSTEISARATQDLTAFNLDFALRPSAVVVNGEPARFGQRGSELSVLPSEPLSEGQRLVVEVDYAGVPSTVEVDGVSPWIRTSDGALAVGQPEISAWWFPGNDHPRDKASYDVAITVPRGTDVVSTGTLAGVEPTTGGPGAERSGAARAQGSTTWRWHNPTQTATYLQFLAIGDYPLETGPGAFGQSFTRAYSSGLGELRQPARDSVESTPEVLEFLAELVGDYPFPSQGGVVASEGLDFALENQMRPVYSPKFFTDGPNTSVVVHENAHQWFGDSVSLNTWRDIWLNEGFASYAEWLWSEHRDNGTAQELFEHYYNSHPADDPFWQVRPGDPGPDNVFHDAVYDRGAMAMHALRNRIGDDALLDATREWVRTKRDDTGTIEEFIAVVERHSGQRLDDFFRIWLFTSGKPEPAEENGIEPEAVKSAPSEPPAVSELDRTHRLLHQH